MYPSANPVNRTGTSRGVTDITALKANFGKQPLRKTRPNIAAWLLATAISSGSSTNASGASSNAAGRGGPSASRSPME